MGEMSAMAPTTTYLSAAQVRSRYGGISDMTLWRWLQDETLAFPQPEWIRNRRFWREDRLTAWDSVRPATPPAPQRRVA
jgi:predicted DNA-binding transcriptional regulator AlpA